MPCETLDTEDLFGLPFTAGTQEAVIHRLVNGLGSGDRALVFTVNVDHVVRLRRRPDLRNVYSRADFVLADGAPVVWASRLLRAGLPERVAGIDLMAGLCDALAGRGGSVFLLGGTQGIAVMAGSALVRARPGLRLAGTHHGFFRPSEEPDIVRSIDRSRADVLFVGLGSPKQEIWAARHAGRLPCAVVMTVGGSLDVLAGLRSRGPRWLQRSGLEWSFRLAQEPGRLWKRYLVQDAAFVPILLGEWWARRRRLGAEATTP